MKTVRIAVVLALGGLLTGVSALADSFQAGDVFASINNGTVAWYRANGTFVQNLTFGGGYTTGSASDASGLWVTNFGASTVTKWDNTGANPSLFGSGYSTPEDVLVDAGGNVFVSSLNGPGLREFDHNGNFLTSFAGGRKIDWFDLSSDESTMYYTDESGTIHRWNLTTNTAMPDLGSGGSFALRLLGDGTLLAADRDRVNHIDATTGAVLNFFMNTSFGDTTGGELFSLNLDSDGTSFWTGDFINGQLYKLKISDGSFLQGINATGRGNLYGVSVFGEECQAGCGGPPKVPEPGSIFLLGTALIGVGTILRKRFA